MIIITFAWTGSIGAGFSFCCTNMVTPIISGRTQKGSGVDKSCNHKIKGACRISTLSRSAQYSAIKTGIWIRIGKHPVHDKAVEPAFGSIVAATGFGFLHVDAERFDQAAVLDTGGTGSLAAAAIEAQVQVPLDCIRHFQPTVGHRSHQIDAAAGAVIFVACFQIRWAGRRAESAVDAI